VKTGWFVKTGSGRIDRRNTHTPKWPRVLQVYTATNPDGPWVTAKTNGVDYNNPTLVPRPDGRYVRKQPFLTITFIYLYTRYGKIIILPRQARDRHRETQQNFGGSVVLYCHDCAHDPVSYGDSVRQCVSCAPFSLIKTIICQDRLGTHTRTVSGQRAGAAFLQAMGVMGTPVPAAAGEYEWKEWAAPAGKKKVFPPLFRLKLIILPRQARDKHRKHSFKRPFSYRGSGWRPD
jgi:hypothetical protein